ncbi:MAG TPA: tannase/feruloyl esterase family alpha/beta hydrolase [Candidatus Saccharimonadales bacterium]|nr:tannase/feruloyl esterase family alpha/beta hydrolase [Candidatus Saccharimonadales bacterium]
MNRYTTARTQVLLLTITVLFAGNASRALTSSCESLRELKLKDTTITSADSVAAGKLTLPGQPESPVYQNLPAFCRVTAEIKPAADSDIKIEVWLPLTGWNGKYQGQGNGGFAGMITYPGLAGAVARGYASASTDTGHTAPGTDATWALGHQEKIIDFGYRAIHEMTLKAKAIIHAFYGDQPRKSYFASCSNGGRQALMEAQRFPEDYDGIVAGAPANDWIRLLIAGVWDLQALQHDDASYIPADRIPAIGAAVLAACDKQDGVADGIVNNPPACRFDPAALLCKEKEPASAACLTAPQVDALKKVYAGPASAKGEQIFPGYSVGGETGPGGWPLWISGAAPGRSFQSAFTNGFFKNMVFDNANWDFHTFNFETGIKIAEDKQAGALNATNPDLKAFQARGGKLMIYHGWSDAAIPPLNAVRYYNKVLATMGARDTTQFVRLYMVPGMQHCAGGPGPNAFDQFGASAQAIDPQHSIFSALEEWVEKGTAPGKIIATKYADDRNPGKDAKMTRPLCVYPQVAKYKGTGDTNAAENFECAESK